MTTTGLKPGACSLISNIPFKLLHQPVFPIARKSSKPKHFLLSISVGLQHLKQLNVNSCMYVTDVSKLLPVKETLEELEIGNCGSISDISPLSELKLVQLNSLLPAMQAHFGERGILIKRAPSWIQTRRRLGER